MRNELRKNSTNSGKLVEGYDKDQLLPDMQDPDSKQVEEMARVFREHGLEKESFLPKPTGMGRCQLDRREIRDISNQAMEVWS